MCVCTHTCTIYKHLDLIVTAHRIHFLHLLLPLSCCFGVQGNIKIYLFLKNAKFENYSSPGGGLLPGHRAGARPGGRAHPPQAQHIGHPSAQLLSRRGAHPGRQGRDGHRERGGTQHVHPPWCHAGLIDAFLLFV